MDMEHFMDEARRRVDAYGFLAQAFLTPPNQDVLRQLAAREPAQAEVLGLVPGADIEELRRTIEADYNRVFLGMSAHAIAPYESVYTSDNHLLMQDARDEVLAAYRSEGVQIAVEDKLPEDHLAFELGFMHHVYARAIEAFDAGNEDEAQRLLETARDFFGAHVANWVPLLCADAKRRVSSAYYHYVCDALDLLVEEDALFFETS